MLITTDTDALEATIEITRGHVFVNIWGYEVFLKLESGLPPWVFHEETTEDARELWALGVYVVVCKAEPERFGPRRGSP